MEIKLPKIEFDIEKYLKDRESNINLLKSGKLTKREFNRRFFNDDAIDEINRHVKEIERIANENNMPLSFDYSIAHASMMEAVMNETYKKIDEMYKTAELHTAIKYS